MCIKSPIAIASVEDLDRYHARIAFYDYIRACYQYKFLQVEVHPQYQLFQDKEHFNIGLITVNH